MERKGGKGESIPEKTGKKERGGGTGGRAKVFNKSNVRERREKKIQMCFLT